MKQAKGWFLGLGRDGDRTLDQQMVGLEQLLLEVPGKSVLDAGCAEGLISIELAKAGASACTGLEVVARYIPVAREQAGDLPCNFVHANLNDHVVQQHGPVDIVIMLAILHKLKNPSAVCAALAGMARDLVVIRLPPYGLVIRDARSNNEPHDIGAVMDAAGFTLESVVAGPLDEWLGYFRRTPVYAPEMVAAPVEAAPIVVAEPEAVEVMSTPDPEPAATFAAETRQTRARRGRQTGG